jgi:hypothetical protein
VWGFLLKFGWLLGPVIVRAMNLGLDYLEYQWKEKKAKKDAKILMGEPVSAASHEEMIDAGEALKKMRMQFNRFQQYSKKVKPQQ